MRSSIAAEVLVLCLGVLPLSTARGEDHGSTAAAGTVRLASGLIAKYEYHFNRNALRDSRRLGETLIALTESGNLLRFDFKTLQLTGEWFGPVAVVCLGQDRDPGVLAALADGRVYRVDPRSFAFTLIARVPGVPHWLGTRAGGGAKPGLVVLTEELKWVRNDEGARWQRPYSVVHNLSRRWSLALPRRATATYLDGRGRLWLGADEGEFGGWCAYLDLDTGRLHDIPGLKDNPNDNPWDGVYGFHELEDGQVWAYGGLIHMSLKRAFIRRVDRGQAEAIYRNDNFGIPLDQEENAPRPGRPILPISHIRRGPQADELLVFSFSDIFRTDPALRRWEDFHELDIAYRPGRRDAMGAYPSLRAVEILDEPRGALLGTTAVDGLVRIAGKTETHAILPGQLGSDTIERAESSVLGILFTSLDDPYNGATPWAFRNGKWETITRFGVVPPVDWSRHDLLVEPDGEVMSVTMIPGELITTRWRGEKATILGREKTQGTFPFQVGGTFVTPDREVWAAHGDELKRLVDGEWRLVYTLPGAERDNQVKDLGDGRFQLVWDDNRWIGRRLVVVDRSGPPWILFDRDQSRLWKLSYNGDQVGKPRFEPIRLADAEKAPTIRDAIVSAPGELILATDCGLKLYTIATGGLHSHPAAEAAAKGLGIVTALGRDGLGRLWLGGNNLALLEADGDTLHSLSALPMLGRSKVSALAADPAAPDGIAAVLEERGVVFLGVARPTQKPSD